MRKFTALAILMFLACGGSSGGKKASDGSAPGPSADGGQSIIASGLSCPAVKPCGGNPVGTWNVTNFCLAGLGESMAAQSQTDGGVLSGVDRCLTEIRLVVDGIIEFQADGTYATKNMTEARLEFKFVDSCLRNQGKSCVTQDGCGPVGADGVCACTRDESSDNSPNSTSGVFKARRDVLYLAGNDKADASTTSTASACTSFLCDVQNRKSVSLIDYCVEGDTLKFIESESSDIYTVITAVRASGPGTVAALSLPTQAPDSPAPVVAPIAVNAGDPVIDTFKSCGGIIVGTWNITKLSLDSSLQAKILKYVRNIDENGECAVAVDVTDTGSLVFQPHSSNFSGGAGYCSFAENPAIAVSYSSACLTAKAKSCVDLDGSLKAETLASDAGAIVGCALASDGNCTCTKAHQYSFPNCEYDTDSIMSDFYTAPVDISHDVTATDTHYYCVSGNTLSVQDYEFRTDGFSGTAIMTAVRGSDPATGRDAGTDAPRPDAAADRPNADAGADASTDKPKADAVVDAPRVDVNVVDVSPIDTQPIDTTPVPYTMMPPSMPASCKLAATAPCGGDISGGWKLAGTCDPWLSETEFLGQMNKDCAKTADLVDNGPASFSADGSCSLVDNSTYTMDYSTGCLTSQLSDTCVAKDQRIKNEIGSNYVTDASCSLASTDICRCMNTFGMPPADAACTYSVSGNELTFVSPPGTFEAGTYDYCVQGTTLTIFVTPTSAAGLACDSCNAGFVLVRTN
jgi:hypothetical protein